MEKKKRKPNGYWTYDRCKEEAKKYDSKRDFYRGCIGAYNAAKLNKWLDDWFVDLKKHNYWTKEKCYEAASGCLSRSMFREKYSRAYALSIKNGWINEWTWLKRQIHEGSDYWIYAYEDEENKVVYVGLTWRKTRHDEHKIDKNDTARCYFESIGKPLPNPKIKMTELDAENAQYYEDWYKLKYAEAGWRVLNKAATGVGVGSLGGVNILWEYDNCKEEASKYSTKSDFRKNSGGAYSAAYRNGWLDEWFGKCTSKPRGYWTKKRCIEEASKYSTLTEFSTNSGGAYEKARINGWLDECNFVETRKPAGYWTKERCYEEAMNYNSEVSFRKGCSSAYNVSYANDWLKDYFWFVPGKKPQGYWNNYEHCKEIAVSCRTIKEMSEKSYAAYGWSKKNGWLSDWFEEVIKPAGFWNEYSNCKEESAKYATRCAFALGNGSAYEASRKNGWLDEFFPKKVA